MGSERYEYLKKDKFTGEIFEPKNPVVELMPGDSVRRKEQDEYYQMKLQQTEMQKDYGPFTWMLYRSEEGVLSYLTQSTVTRLIYMATFLGYDGYLVHDNYKTLKRDQLKQKINVSEREFNSFWKEIAIDHNIVYEENTRIFMNKDIFIKGELPKKVIKNKEIVRLAAKGVRALYENVDSVRSHKNLSYLFKIIPFVNKEWNIVCKNPKEKERELIDYMTVAEFCEAIGYSKANARKLINILSNITFNGKPALIYVTMDFNVNKSKITMNPNLYWAGTDWNNVKYLSYWFNV